MGSCVGSSKIFPEMSSTKMSLIDLELSSYDFYKIKQSVNTPDMVKDDKTILKYLYIMKDHKISIHNPNSYLLFPTYFKWITQTKI